MSILQKMSLLNATTLKRLLASKFTEEDIDFDQDKLNRSVDITILILNQNLSLITDIIKNAKFYKNVLACHLIDTNYALLKNRLSPLA